MISPTERRSATEFGTGVVIGAIATNLFGFRYCRCDGGNDVHRTWSNYECAGPHHNAASSVSSGLE